MVITIDEFLSRFDTELRSEIAARTAAMAREQRAWARSFGPRYRCENTAPFSMESERYLSCGRALLVPAIVEDETVGRDIDLDEAVADGVADPAACDDLAFLVADFGVFRVARGD